MRGTSSPRRPVTAAGAARAVLALAGAALLIASAAIHLDLYLTGYRTIPTIGWMFLLQVISGFALAALVLGALVLAGASGIACQAASGAGALFALATLGGYLLSLKFGLFGFREVQTTAGLTAGIIDVAAFATLAYVALPLLSAGLFSDRFPRVVQRGAGPGASVVAVAAVALLAAGYASAPGGSSGAGSGTTRSAGGQVLRTAKIGGVTVLTNNSGRTLYLFAPDTATTSKCYGECATYWPPVYGKPTAGPGVTGRLGTITRSDGTMQATYDGHPLYTFVSDTGPGTASGNNVNLNGGYWYEIKL